MRSANLEQACGECPGGKVARVLGRGAHARRVDEVGSGQRGQPGAMHPVPWELGIADKQEMLFSEKTEQHWVPEELNTETAKHQLPQYEESSYQTNAGIYTDNTVIPLS
ncbi:hypothetical protein H920_01283 [Fukomys damarensis]|uniref:Uncharacterized protein n=1 Tax=Fukomys damarensis TaxID=885580 RepID=A0A091ENT4_FUKDA|nr:hypothetical protein H920_01283 [Fukomys damarensis]